MNEPAAVRRKPTETEVIRWTGDNLDALHAFAGEHHLRFDDETLQVYDFLHETWVNVFTGQYLIRGPQGEFYPIDESALTATYERLDEPS